MALFFHDSPDFDMSRRMSGFNRYRQLLSNYGKAWICTGCLTVLGALPLAAGLFFAGAFSSVLLLVPFSLIGGMISGPFLAALFDALFRGFRDAPGNWWDYYRRNFKRNLKDSLLPGALTGLFTGILYFMFYIMASASRFPSAGTIVLYLLSIFLFIIIELLYWPQLVLFSQKNTLRVRNILLFFLRHSRKVFLAGLIILAYLILFVLFAPLTLLLLPVTGIWYPFFVSEFLLYDFFNEDYRIEEQYIPIEGDPWR